jgi:ketosteroid isomerase-like protein
MATASEQVVRDGYSAFSAGDMDALRGLMVSDMVHSVPGDNLISGDYKGIDDVIGLYGKLFELTDGTMSVTLSSATATGDDHVIAKHTGKAERNGRTLDSDATLDFTIKDGKIARIDESSDDQAAEDAFWA